MLSLAEMAEASGSFAPAVAARSKASGMMADLERLTGEREAEEETDPLLRVQRLRRMATEAGSYVAAANFMKAEQQIADARAAAARAGGEGGMDDIDDEGLVAIVEGAILALPDLLVIRVRDAAIARLGPGIDHRATTG